MNGTLVVFNASTGLGRLAVDGLGEVAFDVDRVRIPMADLRPGLAVIVNIADGRVTLVQAPAAPPVRAAPPMSPPRPTTVGQWVLLIPDFFHSVTVAADNRNGARLNGVAAPGVSFDYFVIEGAAHDLQLTESVRENFRHMHAGARHFRTSSTIAGVPFETHVYEGTPQLGPGARYEVHLGAAGGDLIAIGFGLESHELERRDVWASLLLGMVEYAFIQREVGRTDTALPRVSFRLLIADTASFDLLVDSCPEFAGLRVRPEKCYATSNVLARVATSREIPRAVLEPHFPPGELPRYALALDLCITDQVQNARRGQSAADPAQNSAARQSREAQRAAARRPGAPDQDEPHLALVREVLALAHRAAPHCIAVVVPEARDVFSPEVFVRRTREDIRDTRRIAGQTVLRSYDVDRAGRWVQTQGQVLYGLPEVGLCAIELSDPREAIAILEELSADMLTWGYAPPQGEEVTLARSRWRVSRQGLAVWLEPVGASDAFLQQSRAANEHATFRTIARRHLRSAPLVQAYLNFEGSPAPIHSIEVLVDEKGTYYVTTNGLSARPRPGVTGEVGCIEIFVEAPGHGLPLAKVLSLLGQMAFEAPANRPIQLFDRLAFQDPIGGIAGVVVVPYAAMTTFATKRITWCQAVPITEPELAALRGGTLSSRQIAEAMKTNEGRSGLSARWQGVLEG